LSAEHNSAIKVAKGVRETVNEDGAALLDIERGFCFSMNPVGAKIWEMVKGGYAANQIVDSLEEEFRLPRTQLDSDVSDFLKQLAKMKLVGGESERLDSYGLFSRFVARRRSAE
jgi:hypothetical protein